MATKKKVRYLTPIGTFNYPWLDQPSKWSNSARDGQGGSIPAERTDVQARYSVKVSFAPDEFDKSDFKKNIDDVWSLTQDEYKGKFKATKPPYWTDEDGNYVFYSVLDRADARELEDGHLAQLKQDVLNEWISGIRKEQTSETTFGSEEYDWLVKQLRSSSRAMPQ